MDVGMRSNVIIDRCFPFDNLFRRSFRMAVSSFLALGVVPGLRRDMRAQISRSGVIMSACVRECVCGCVCVSKTDKHACATGENTPYSKIIKKHFFSFFIILPKNKIDIFLTLKYNILFIIHNNTFKI